MRSPPPNCQLGGFSLVKANQNCEAIPSGRQLLDCASPLALWKGRLWPLAMSDLSLVLALAKKKPGMAPASARIDWELLALIYFRRRKN
jgi:hypothetical protein